ncbi:hypothetical protein D3C71_958760 [compost metagenome]
MQRLDDARLLQVVHVVEHQHQLSRMLGDALNQGDHPMFDSHLVVVTTQQETGIAHPLRHDFSQTGLQATRETFQIVVFGRQRQPGHIEIHGQQLASPSQQRTGLATPGRPLDHHATLPANFLQTRQQVFARHQAPGPARRHNLGIGDGLVSVG